MERSDDGRISYVHLRRWRYPSTLGPYAAEPAVRAQLLTTGGLTIAYRVNEKKGTATVAVARCNPRDHYWKGRGRQIAAYYLTCPLDMNLVCRFDVLLDAERSVIAQVVRSVLAHRQWRGNLL